MPKFKDKEYFQTEREDQNANAQAEQEAYGLLKKALEDPVAFGDFVVASIAGSPAFSDLVVKIVSTKVKLPGQK